MSFYLVQSDPALRTPSCYGQFSLSLGNVSPHIFSKFNPLNTDTLFIRTLSMAPFFIIIIIIIIVIIVMIIIETYIIELIQVFAVIVIAKEDFFSPSNPPASTA